MKKKLVIVLVAWLLIFAAAYATEVESIQKLSNRNTLSTATDFISEIIPPTGGGGGGGGEGTGGSGVSTFESLSNIDVAETIKANIKSDTPTIFRFLGPAFGIYEISVTGKGNINDVALRVELLKNMSTLVEKPAPDMIYKYQNVWTGSQEIKDIIIRFKVDNSWISNNGMSDTNIVMLRWDNNNKEWTKLETSMVNKDDSYTYFESRPESFSQFAIVGLKERITIDYGEDTYPVVTTPSPISTTPGDITAPKSSSMIPIFGVIVIIVVVSAIYLKRRRS